MITKEYYDEVWGPAGFYREGSTCLRLIPFLLCYIPFGSVINDFGSGTGRAEVELLKNEYKKYKINMVDISDVALEQEAKDLIGERLTYTICPLESLPEDFPVADWGICINVLMVVDPLKLDAIMKQMMKSQMKGLPKEQQEKLLAAMDKDPEFLNNVQFFWQQSLIKLVLDKKIKEIALHIKVNDGEIRDYYQANKDTEFKAQDLPAVYDQIKWLILNKKQKAMLDDWVNSLHSESKISINKSLLKAGE